MGNLSCKIDNGEGEKAWWPWAECEITECDTGYQEEDGKCVIISGPCTLNPAVANALTYVYDESGVCVVENCETGYVLRDGQCIVSEYTPNGSGSDLWGAGSGPGDGDGDGTVDQWGVCTTTSQCKNPYKCLASNVAANNSKCQTVESCVQAAEQDDSLEHNCYGQPIIRGYSDGAMRPSGSGANKTSIEECSQHADSQSGTGFMWISPSFGGYYGGRCFVFDGIPAGVTLKPYVKSSTYMTGCVDKTKRFPNCS